LAYLIRYDSAYGKYHNAVSVERANGEVWLQVGAHRLRLLAERRPEDASLESAGRSDRRRSQWRP
jgi:hypothetical protein